jgi:hypothetical protein
MTNDKIAAEIKSLSEELLAAQREYWRLMYDEEADIVLGPPTAPNQIAKVEKMLGKPLPPSYRAFLELHNGWSGFDGDGKILAVEDYGSAWVQGKLNRIEVLFGENKQKSPFKKGALPIMLGDDITNFLVVDPNKVRADGEMDFVTFDYSEKEDTFKSFADFLRDRLKTQNALVKEEKKGTKKRAKK